MVRTVGGRYVSPMIEAFWAEFVAATGIDGEYEAWAFGNPKTMPELSTELALLVRDGPKRATAGLLAEYEEEGEDGVTRGPGRISPGWRRAPDPRAAGRGSGRPGAVFSVTEAQEGGFPPRGRPCRVSFRRPSH